MVTSTQYIQYSWLELNEMLFGPYKVTFDELAQTQYFVETKQRKIGGEIIQISFFYQSKRVWSRLD